jgi:hypothetical protein
MKEYIINPKKPTITVEFSIFGVDNFNTTDLSRKLGLFPKIDSTKTNATASEISSDLFDTRWVIQTDACMTYFAEDQLKEMINMLSLKKNEIISFTKKHDLKCRFCIIIDMYNHCPPSVYFDNETIKFINDITADLDFDIYCSDLNDEDYGNVEDD